VIVQGADTVGRISLGSGSMVTQVVTKHLRGTDLGVSHMPSDLWSGWPDLNRRPLRPEPREHGYR
jgi:hypothetical protein